MSSDIVWQTIRNNSAFLKTRRNVPKRFSTERFNLMAVNSQRYNGLVNKKGVHIQLSKDGKKVDVLTKIAKNEHLPQKSTRTVSILSKNGRRARNGVANLVKTYKKRDIMPAQRFISQLLRGTPKAKK
ncbi:unnamed protein product, partial [Mesorhabditis belari]|uniref:Large ribosomal subunit protein eL28 n=1 Tax=Mesorhabditis belari TaxID=2138241 RepID=A0AAF3F439_9BILA